MTCTDTCGLCQKNECTNVLVPDETISDSDFFYWGTVYESKQPKYLYTMGNYSADNRKCVDLGLGF